MNEFGLFSNTVIEACYHELPIIALDNPIISNEKKNEFIKKSEIFYRTIPGKLQSYLASGKPIIGSIDGIASQIINNSNCGFCAPAEDSKNLSIQIKKFYNLPIDKRNELGKNALNYYKEFFEKQKVLSNLETIFNKY